MAHLTWTLPTPNDPNTTDGWGSTINTALGAAKTLIDSHDDAIAALAAGTAPDATTSSKGVIQLGGDLTGSATAPTLKTSGVTAGTYGAAGKSAVVTVNSKGLVTAVSEATITGGSSGTAGLFPPESYGAVGNGSTDDTTAVQAAVTAAQNYTIASTTGQVGVIPLRGLYKVSSTITVTRSVAILGLHQTGSGLVAASTFTGTRVLDVSPTAQATVLLDSFTVTDPGTTNVVLNLSTLTRSHVNNLVLTGGGTGLRIGSGVHNSRVQNVRISTWGTYGVDLNGDSSADIWLDNIDASDTGNTATGTAALRIVRTTSGTVGGYHIKNFEASTGSRPLTYGILIDASTATGRASSPVFIQGGLIDGMTTPVAALNWDGVWVDNAWLTAKSTGDVVLLNASTNVKLSENALRGGTNAVAFRGSTATTHTQLVNNRVTDATYAYYLESSGIATSLSFDGDDIVNGASGANVTNNLTWLSAAVTSTQASGQTMVTGSTAESALVLQEPGGVKTHIRRGTLALEFLNSTYSTVIASLSNGGSFTINSGLFLNSSTAPTAAASEQGSIRYKAGGAGVADILQVCLKSAADTYSWKTIATG